LAVVILLRGRFVVFVNCLSEWLIA